MAYTVDFSDSTKTAITVNDGTVNTTDTSLALVGKNFYNYGEYIAEDLLHLLEHFAKATAPANPVQGQLWYDNANDVFQYYDDLYSIFGKDCNLYCGDFFSFNGNFDIRIQKTLFKRSDIIIIP